MAGQDRVNGINSSASPYGENRNRPLVTGLAAPVRGLTPTDPGPKGVANCCGGHLNRVDIVGDAHELSLLLLAQLGDVVDAKLDADRLLLVLLRAGLLLLRLTLHTLLLGLLVLRPVLVQQLEQVDGQVLVQRVLELVDRRRHLQPLVQHLALALDAHVLRPLDVAAEVTLRLNVLANSEVLRLLLPDRARRRGRRRRRLLRVHVGSRSRGLLSLGSLCRGRRAGGATGGLTSILSVAGTREGADDGTLGMVEGPEDEDTLSRRPRRGEKVWGEINAFAEQVWFTKGGKGRRVLATDLSRNST
eukprot:scaffold110467_cov63-Phaeocystis_antarctica.AAC.4